MVSRNSWMSSYLKKIALISRQILVHFLDTRCSLSATALAYTTLLSVVPLMFLSMGIFSLFPSLKSSVQVTNNFLFQHFVPSVADQITRHIEIFVETASAHYFTSFIVSLISSLILIYSLESEFNSIWKTSGRPFLRALWLYSAALVLLPVVAVIIFSIHAFLYYLPFFSSLQNFLSFLPVLSFIAPLITWSAFFLLYKFLPNCPVRYRYAAVGALVAAISFEILKRVFGIYITHFSSFTVIYGALAAIPIFLTWLFLSWSVVLLGGVVSFISQINSGIGRRIRHDAYTQDDRHLNEGL